MLVDPMQHSPREDRDGGANPLEGLDYRPLLGDQVEQIGVERIRLDDAVGESSNCPDAPSLPYT